MKLKAIAGIALTMLLLAVGSPIDVSVGVVDFDGGSGDFVAQSGVDWWPMFHHDLNHTGYSTSTAPNTNNTIWIYPTGYRVLSSPAVFDGKVYVGSDGNTFPKYYGKVYCLNASTGAHIWNYTTGDDVFSSPAVADGKVYVGSNDGRVYCLNATTGAYIWNSTIGGVPWQGYSSPAVADGKVYVGSMDRNVYCLNASTGAHIWSYTTGDYVSSSPAVADGKVYVGSYDGKVYAFGPSYTLAVHSSPTGVTFAVDGVSRTTPWSGTYSEDTSVSLVMPETHDGYVWSNWLEDGDTNRIKTVTMDTDILLTAMFTPPDTTPPTISIVSPENKTYHVADVALTFTASESTSWVGYSLDGQANVSITGNTTLSGLSDGSHSLIVYAKDTAGNTGASQKTNFTIETKQEELFPTWIVATIVIIAIVGAAILVYFTKIKKTTQKVK